MTEAQGLLDRLSQVSISLDDGLDALTAALQRADEAVATFAMLGGSAERAQAVSDAIEALHAEVQSLSEGLTDVGAALGRIDATLSPDANVAHLAVATDGISAATDATTAAIDACDKAETDTGAHLAGSRAAGEIAAQVSEARDHLEQARTGLDRMAEEATAQQDLYRRHRTADAATTATHRPAPGTTVAVPGPVTKGWVRPDDVPGRVRQGAAAFTPRPDGTNRPTVGVFNGQDLESGGRDAGIAADLLHDPLRGYPFTFYQHVESKAAARMRQQRLQEAELVLDNTVCGTNERDRDQPWSCDRILPSILPAGSRLTVWVTRDAGATWWRARYTGTGERITR